VIEEPLYLSGYDVYNNRVAISNVPEELHLKVGQLDGEFLELSVTIPRGCINLCADNAALELKVQFEFVASIQAIAIILSATFLARGLELDG